MNVYDASLKCIVKGAIVHKWPLMATMAQQLAGRRPHDWQLPVLAAVAVGGDGAAALPAVSAIACCQIAIILVDDMLDEDVRGYHQQLGMAQTANLASAFQATALELMANCSASRPVRLQGVAWLNQMMATTALGQAWDSQNPAGEADYWQLIHTKSSPFFGAALAVGALLGGADEALAEQLRQFGHLYGEMIQIHDDLHDSMAVPAGADWLQGRSPLPILYAQLVDHPGRERFLALRQEIHGPSSLREAQQILLQCGAISYCIHQLLSRISQAQTMLAQLPLPHPQPLQQLLAELTRPVQTLLPPPL